MSEPDLLTAALLQLSAHTDKLTQLDRREASHAAETAERITALTALANAMKHTLDDQAEILAGLNDLDDKVARVTARLDDIAPADDTSAQTYQPSASPRFWKLDGQAREDAIARLRAWVEHVYQPGYGQLAASLGGCWEQHLLCLYALDWLSELWSVLYLQPTRTTGTLAGQAEWQTRLLTAVAEQMAAETARCEHAALRAGPPGPDRNQVMSSNSSRDRVRPATHPSCGNGAVPIAAGPRGAVAWALAYASRGWPVFPCQLGTKEPATRHGFHDASTDPDRIRSWWERNPRANLAIATGAPGPDVLDVDHHGPAGSGYSALTRLKRADLLDTAGTIVRTPHSGLHVYFGGSRQASGRVPRHHLDFKSGGGYVLAPPSQVDGKSYQLVREALPSGGLGWATVTGLLEPQPDRPARPVLAASGDVGRLAAWVERLEEGNRNAGLFWAACRAVESSQPGWLDEIAAAAAKTGLTEREISRTIDSARRDRERRAESQPEWEAAT